MAAGGSWDGGTGWGRTMSRCAETFYENTRANIRANRIDPGIAPVPAGIVRKIVRLSAIALAGAWLAGCMQTSQATRNAAAPAASRQASLARDRAPASVKRRVAATRRHPPSAPPPDAAESKVASQGLASFYS